jgi:hypothetical protein
MSAESRALSGFLRNHWLTIAVSIWALASFGIFSWAERGYFCDQASDHKSPCQGFWSSEHLHDWIYNAASNWQSELLFGVLLVVLLHRSKGGDS